MVKKNTPPKIIRKDTVCLSNKLNYKIPKYFKLYIVYQKMRASATNILWNFFYTSNISSPYVGIGQSALSTIISSSSAGSRSSCITPFTTSL